MSRPSAVLFCPGRGSYSRNELGSIKKHLRPGELADALEAADHARAKDGRPTITELDSADGFRPGLHLEGRNAAELIFFSTLAHAEALRETYDIIAVTGNSMGWYTALSAAGCLSMLDGLRLVTSMARAQQIVQGGQILTTTIDGTWTEQPELAAGIDEALDATNAMGSDYFVARSIHLGAHQVLAGTASGVKELLTRLPKVESSERSFPFQIAGHGPFHTALCLEVAQTASADLENLPMRTPRVHLIDGMGNVHSPWSADPADLLHYTTTRQVIETFDFTAAVRTAMREFNPDVLLCAGPGSSLRSPVGHVVLREGYHQIHDKAALFASDLVRIG